MQCQFSAAMALDSSCSIVLKATGRVAGCDLLPHSSKNLEDNTTDK